MTTWKADNGRSGRPSARMRPEGAFHKACASTTDGKRFASAGSRLHTICPVTGRPYGSVLWWVGSYSTNH